MADPSITMSLDDTLELDTIIEESTKASNPIGNIEYEGNDSTVHNLENIQTHTSIFNPQKTGNYKIPVNGQEITIKVIGSKYEIYDDFESNNLTEWNSLSDAGGNQEISSKSLNGEHSAKVYVNSTGSASRLHGRTFDLSNYSQIQLTCYTRHEDNSGPYIVLSPDSTGFNWIGVHYRYSNNLFRIEDRQKNEFSSKSASLNTGDWYEFETIIDIINDKIRGTIYDTNRNELHTKTLQTNGDISSYGTFVLAIMTGTNSGNKHVSYFDDVRYYAE